MNLEQVPDYVLGRLLSVGVPVYGGYIHQVNGELELYITAYDSQKSCDEFISKYLPLICQHLQLLELFPLLTRFGLKVEQHSQENQWATSQNQRYLYASVAHILHNLDRVATLKAIFREGDIYAPKPACSIYQWIGQDSLTNKSYRRVFVLSRIPGLLLGQLHQTTIGITRVEISKDKNSYLVLYVEFPIGDRTTIDIETTIMEIIVGTIEYFTQYEELSRLKIWTSPDYDDKVAISSFWLERESLLDWKNQKISDEALRHRRTDYNP